MVRSYYITTPIYYPNGEPHLGHLYTTLCADTIARFHRLLGEKVHFLTGTDEHGIKMVKTAAEKETTPAALADKNANVFVEAFKQWNVSNDDFIRTTQDRHKRRVQAIVSKLIESGDIYLGAYEGWYDEGQEEFITENNAKAQEYKSAISGRPLTRYSEPTYFFKLSKYAPDVLKFIEGHPEFIQPAAMRNKVISGLKEGVDDLSISRATLKWGIPMPNDPGHVLYVWIDALSNYITAVGYPEDVEAAKRWPADLHLIGKEILWFHAVYWPAMLMAVGQALPKKLFAHGWWTSNGKKMSKTMGNFIDLERLNAYAAAYGQDSVRYYLLKAAPFGNDLDFSESEYHAAVNELANVPGNLLNRTLKMVNSYTDGVVPEAGPLEEIDRKLIAEIEAFPARLENAYAELDLQACALLGVELARAANVYIDATAPFKMKDPSQAQRRGTVLAITARATATAFAGLIPVLPGKAPAGLKQLNIGVEGKTLGDLVATANSLAGQKVGQGEALFPKVQPLTK